MTPEALLNSGLEALSLPLDGARRDLLLEFVALLEKWNKVYNLTALRERELMVSHHLLDSLAILPHIAADALADIGSGAGLPGVPLAIAKPELDVTLIEPTDKRVAFLRQVVASLKLPNVTIVAKRVEDVEAVRRYPAIVSRAFADLRTFVASCRHLLLPGGAFYAMKGTFPADEIAQLPAGFRVREALRIAVPFLEAQRHLIIVETVE